MDLDSTAPFIKLNIYLFTTHTCTLLEYFYVLGLHQMYVISLVTSYFAECGLHQRHVVKKNLKSALTFFDQKSDK